MFWLFLVLILGGSILLNLALGVMGTQFGGLEAQGGLARETIRPGHRSETVAVYRVIGIIDGAATAEFKQFYHSVVDDSDVKAVVLRIDSPGGGVTASDQICEMVKQIKAAGKKVVVSMGSVAASGGYYISAPADEIFAEETSITGSIGVITGWVVLKGTLDKIGAEALTIKSTHAQSWKDEMSPTTMPQDYQLQHIQEVLDEMQARFEDVVKTGRGERLKTNLEVVKVVGKDGKVVQHENTEPFNGKIYLASKAKQLGLIDQIGYEDAAIDHATQLARLSKPKVVRYARRRTFMEALMDGKSDASLKIDTKLIDQLQTPRFMMLWKAE
jgi:protease-4